MTVPEVQLMADCESGLVGDGLRQDFKTTSPCPEMATGPFLEREERTRVVRKCVPRVIQKLIDI